MSVTFTKLFSSITESTIWVAPDSHRLCWITMLAMADRRGRVFGSIPGLANRARISVQDTEAALQSFLSPDPYSRTKAYEGRRIEPIDGGWRLLNYEKYRAVRDEESIKESKRRYINARRAVENVDKSRTPSIQAEAEAEAGNSKAQVAPMALPVWLDRETWTSYVQSRKAPARKPAALQAAIAKLDKFRAAGHDPNAIVATSLANGWQGLFEPKAGKSSVPDYSTLVDK